METERGRGNRGGGGRGRGRGGPHRGNAGRQRHVGRDQNMHTPNYNYNQFGEGMCSNFGTGYEGLPSRDEPIVRDMRAEPPNIFANHGGTARDGMNRNRNEARNLQHHPEIFQHPPPNFHHPPANFQHPPPQHPGHQYNQGPMNLPGHQPHVEVHPNAARGAHHRHNKFRGNSQNFNPNSPHIHRGGRETFDPYNPEYSPQPGPHAGIDERPWIDIKSRQFQHNYDTSPANPRYTPDFPREQGPPVPRPGVTRGQQWNSETNLHRVSSIESLKSEKSLNLQRNDRKFQKQNRPGWKNHNKNKKDLPSKFSSNPPDMGADMKDDRPLSRSSSYSIDLADNQPIGTESRKNDQKHNFIGKRERGPRRRDNVSAASVSSNERPHSRNSSMGNEFFNDLENFPLTGSGLENKNNSNRIKNRREKGKARRSNGPGMNLNSGSESRRSSCSNEDNTNIDVNDGINENHQSVHVENFSQGNGEQFKQRKSKKAKQGGKNENIPNLQISNITLEQLEKLNNYEPLEIVQMLSAKESEYSSILLDNLEPKIFILVVEILSKICETPPSQMRAEIFRHVSLPNFTDQLFTCVTDYPYQEDDSMLQQVNQFFENAISLYETLADFMPSAIRMWRNHIVEVQKSLKIMTKNPKIELNHDLLKKVKYLLDEIGENLKEEVNETKEQKHEKKNETYFPEPVGDFRTVSLYPRPEDIYAEQPFLYPNIIKGPYRSVDHYLDIHFKLLREDFMSPIRQAMRDYKKQCNTKDRYKRVDNVRIYRRVKFLHPKTVLDTVGYEVCFDVDKKINRVNWEFCSRFMYGSLLLFTDDNFDSFFLATVANRNVKELENKLVTVELVENVENVKSIIGKEFIMAESEAYFNPYFQVLKALQRFNETNFPLAKYIVEVSTETEPPRYLNYNEIYSIKGPENNFVFRVLNDMEWPTPDQLALDPSQYSAFKAALTNDLTVIQGPPGTGKTFLGLKIAQALLGNSHLWNQTNTPIFVVCFTNHALDQFLEGLLPVTTKLVRIGGKSKGSELDKFNIRERRKEYSYYKKVQGREIRDLKLKMSTVFKDIQVYQSDLKALENTTGVVSFRTLQLVMIDEQRNYFSGDEDFLDWLLEGVAGAKNKEKVKITITADRGVVREAPTTDPLIADAEDMRVKQALFDTIDLDTSVGPSEDTIAVQFACDIDSLVKKRDSLQQLHGRNRHHRTQLVLMKETYEMLDLMITHLRKELVESKKNPCSDLEKESLLHQTYLRGLKPNERWKLYHTWVNILREGLMVTLANKDAEYKGYSYRYEQLRQNDDLQILKTANVVGTTTTLAAKFQPMFEALAPRIVIVEEAAEVLEAHIIASISKSCQHMILIGDHKQLRPNVAEVRLARQYHLDVSLFERLVNNNMACHTLTLQHRMRPEISKQLVPTIYPLLRDDPSVLGRADIKGMDKNVFFMTHNNFEDEVTEITSKRNRFEAEILLNLAKYLVQQGYKPQEITILATYKGQMYHMKNEIKNMTGFPKGIQITVVDNFQGEENKIILLSLVRSNSVNKIGFLEIENRICVALSRARDGLYIVGNMNCLVSNSEIWKKIRSSLAQQNCYGPTLNLCCQIHQEQKTKIESAKDFSKVSEGGCSLLCGQPLPCNHTCKSMCHVEQDYHQRYKCKEQCRKILCKEGHVCPKKCHQPCGQCQVPVRKLLDCRHSADIPCYKDIREHACQEPVQLRAPFCNHLVTIPCHSRYHPTCNLPCTKRLECGHSCQLVCHEADDPDHLDYACEKPCARLNRDCSNDHKCQMSCFEECKPCLEMAVRQLPCGHSLKTLCSADLTTIVCQQKCTITLPCGHPCNKKCFQKCEPCEVKVKKRVIGCGHEMEVTCSTPAKRQICTGPCQNTLNCGHQCSKRCMDTCSDQECKHPVKVKERHAVLSFYKPKLFPMLCGHKEAYVPCHKHKYVDSMTPQELMKYCSEPCGKELTCKHVCSGTCSECMQGRIHKVCNEVCGNVLICGHSCKVPCREVCPPCKEPCRHECKHSKCSRKCGEECVSCKEPCDYACPHLKCTRRCGEQCNREPCYEPCPKKLDCQHSCVGFCGEPCPPCRICEPQHFEEIFFMGDETEDDAKWVLLVDCGHTLETTGMEMWLNIEQEGGEIGCKVCPRCKTPIVKVQRFMNIIKKTYQDIQHVKAQCFGNRAEISKIRNEALRRIQNITFIPMRTVNETEDELEKMFTKLKVELSEVKGKKRNTIDSQKLRLLCFWTEYFISVYLRKREVWVKLNEESKLLLNANINCITQLLMKRHERISEQEMQGFEREVKRIHRISDLLVYLSSPEFRYLTSNSIVQETRKAAEAVIYSVTAYDEDRDTIAKSQLKKLKLLIKSSTEVSAEEIAMINKAMSSSFNSIQKTGHWFKCKNGHRYCITECGGAMEEAKCPVQGCGETIGGQNHRLHNNQSLASEMDGARHAAWSDANNMQNYMF